VAVLVDEDFAVEVAHAVVFADAGGDAPTLGTVILCSDHAAIFAGSAVVLPNAPVCLVVDHDRPVVDGQIPGVDHEGLGPDDYFDLFARDRVDLDFQTLWGMVETQ